jgi:hypothetical protein
LASSFAIGIVQRYVAYNIDYPIYYPQALADPFFIFQKLSKCSSPFTRDFCCCGDKTAQVLVRQSAGPTGAHPTKIAGRIEIFKTQIHPHFLFNTLNNLYALNIEEIRSGTGNGIEIIRTYQLHAI